MPVDAAELAATPLFASMSQTDVKAVASWFDVQTSSAGTVLALEGASGYSFFVIAEGTVEITANGAAVATLGPGEFFGEMALLGGGRRLATVTATSDTKLFVLFGTEFRQLEQAEPEIAARITAAMTKRLEELKQVE